jgi:hypothetical protein
MKHELLREDIKIIDWLRDNSIVDYELELSNECGFIVNVNSDVFISKK